jgi:HK97 gp10 family phage protein
MKQPIEGIDDVAKFLDRIPKELGKASTQVVNAMLGPVARQMKKFLTPVKRSGLLRKAMVKKVRAYKSGTTWGAVGPDKGLSGMWGKRKQRRIRPSNYAHLVEGGTKPHTIKFKTRKRVMEHPGTDAHPFRKPALAASKAEAIRKGEEKLAQVMQKAGLT